MRLADVLLFPTQPTLFPMDPGIADAGERERALDIRRSWIVEAPAGSGKTGLLIQRYLKLLADGSIEAPEQVLAITFTNKATAEMRDRVLSQLHAAAGALPPSNDFDRETRPLAEAVLRRDGEAGWSLLAHPRRLNVRTIDSVCSEIARSLPVLSRSGGRLAPSLDPDLLFREAARRTLRQLGGEDTRLSEAIATLLAFRDGNLANCEQLIAEMLGRRDQWARLIPLSEPELDDAKLDAEVLPALERALDLAICRALTQLVRTISSADLHDLTAAAEELAYLDGYRGAPSPLAFCAGRHQPPGERAEHLEHWLALVHLCLTKAGAWRKSFNRNVIEIDLARQHNTRLKDLIGRLQHNDELLKALCQVSGLPPAHYPAEQWVVCKRLFRVLARALVELQLVFAERGECDFAEFALAAGTALAEDAGPDELAAALGMDTRHLLIDEMQDTSISQYDLITRLTRGWDGHSQTVFLVGDPKQSIYRFRQARVERFTRVLQEQRLGDLALGALRLTSNFRSQPGLVEQFNEAFSRVFPPILDPAHPEEVPYVEATAVRPPARSGGLRWHLQALPSTPDTAVRREARRLRRAEDAEAIREIILDWQKRPLPRGRTEPWRIAILVRAREHLAGIAEVLRRPGSGGPVPFRAVEIEPLAERQEVLDLLALTRALLHPADRVAWFAILRAPWCGLGLADLHCLAGSDDGALRERCVADLLEERGPLLSADGKQRLLRIRPILTAAQQQRGLLPLAERVERTWRTLGGDSYLDRREREHADRFFRLLDELEAGGTVDLALLTQRMSRLYADPAVHPGAIDLMTIHKAKGLEWDVVLVPGLERRQQLDRTPLLHWVELDAGDDQAAQVVLAPIQSTGEESCRLLKWIRSVHGTREAAERKRLLYVACTRAREELHLFGTPLASSAGELSAESSSLLETAWPMAKAHCKLAEGAAAPDEAPVFALAAAGEPATPTLRTVARLPLGFDPLARHRADATTGVAPPDPPPVPYSRPEGSFAARAFGNAVHAFLELAAERIATGETPGTLSAQLPGWLPRATAVLRSAGLSPQLLGREAQRVVAALGATLASPEGRWILAAHPDAATEYALAAQPGAHAGVRLDRIFRAGATPHEPGDRFLWIVDYKTGSYGSDGLDTFLEAQRILYTPQLEAYARTVARLAMRQPEPPVGFRVALFYPVVARLVWWRPDLSLEG